VVSKTSGLVVVGVNDTPSSRQAVRAGAREAAQHHCRLELVHAFNWAPTLTRPGEPDLPAARESLLHRAAADARDIASDVPIDVRPFEGPAVVALLRRARVAAMTVIGDGGLSNKVCLPHDALVVQVAARTAGTVLVTRSTPPPATSVVVGVDGSAASHRALQYAFDAAVTRRVALVVVRAGHHDDAATAALVASLESVHGRAVHQQIVDGEPETVMRQAAQHAGLVVVGARGRYPYSGLLGRVAQTMLHHSPAPVVLVRNLMPEPSRTGPRVPGDVANLDLAYSRTPGLTNCAR
jgi:nucleotide-binding universal stress UspA family protein